MPTPDAFEVDPRFCGPPGSGNGGYVCGRLAEGLEGDVRIRLERPPPLGRPLEVRETEDGRALCDGEQVVARAWPTRLDLEVPAAPDFAEASRAAQRYRGHVEHVFPRCFVCGPGRGEGDGMRIFPGPVDKGGLVAAPWIADASLGEPTVRPEFVWAALDCPGCFSFPQPEGRVLLLGELSAHLEGPVRSGERCVVIGWEIEHSGRKHRTGTALFDSAGRCAGHAVGTWLEVSPAPLS